MHATDNIKILNIFTSWLLTSTNWFDWQGEVQAKKYTTLYGFGCIPMMFSFFTCYTLM